MLQALHELGDARNVVDQRDALAGTPKVFPRFDAARQVADAAAGRAWQVVRVETQLAHRGFQPHGRYAVDASRREERSEGVSATSMVL